MKLKKSLKRLGNEWGGFELWLGGGAIATAVFPISVYAKFMFIWLGIILIVDFIKKPWL